MAASTASCATSVARSLAIAAVCVTGRMPPSYAVAAWCTSSRAACRRVATSARRCETAWKSLSGLPNACRAAAWSRAAAIAACAIPTANAPTLGRKRSSVRIATRKPRSTSPMTCSGGTWTSSKTSRPMGCGRDELDRLAGEAGRVARDPERGDPAGAGALRRAGEDRVDVGVRRVGDVDLLAGQPVALAVRRRPRSASAATSLPESGSVRREAGDRLARREPRHPGGDRVRVARLQEGERAQSLHRERRLRLGAVAREPLADEAELHARRRPPASPRRRAGRAGRAGRSRRARGRAAGSARPRAPACASGAMRSRAAVVVVSSSSSWSGCRWASSSGVDIATTAVIPRPPRARPAPSAR